MTQSLKKQLTHLNKLLETSQNPKIVWEEMQILAANAFDLQDQIMAELDTAEQSETDIAAVQQLFETREYVWDIMNQIALAEAHLKEKTFPNGKGEKAHQSAAKTQKGCCCGHHHTHEQTGGCAHHHTEKECCCSSKGTKSKCAQKSGATKKCCRKSK